MGEMKEERETGVDSLSPPPASYSPSKLDASQEVGRGVLLN